MAHRLQINMGPIWGRGGKTISFHYNLALHVGDSQSQRFSQRSVRQVNGKCDRKKATRFGAESEVREHQQRHRWIKTVNKWVGDKVCFSLRRRYLSAKLIRIRISTTRRGKTMVRVGVENGERWRYARDQQSQGALSLEGKSFGFVGARCKEKFIPTKVNTWTLH